MQGSWESALSFFLNLSHDFYFWHSSPAFRYLLLVSVLTCSCLDAYGCLVTVFLTSSLHRSPSSRHHCSHRCRNTWRSPWYVQVLTGWLCTTFKAQWLLSWRDNASLQGAHVWFSKHGLHKMFASLWFRFWPLNAYLVRYLSVRFRFASNKSSLLSRNARYQMNKWYNWEKQTCILTNLIKVYSAHWHSSLNSKRLPSPFSQQIRITHLLRARHYSRCYGNISKEEKETKTLALMKQEWRDDDKNAEVNLCDVKRWWRKIKQGRRTVDAGDGHCATKQGGQGRPHCKGGVWTSC